MNKLYLREAYEALQPIGKQLGMPFWKAPLSESEFDGQVQAVVDEGVKICSFTFGLPDEETVRLLKENDVLSHRDCNDSGRGETGRASGHGCGCCTRQ